MDEAAPKYEPPHPRLSLIANGLTADDLRLCWDVAARSVQLVELWRIGAGPRKVWEPGSWERSAFERHVTADPLPLMIDWATAQYCEPMNLRRLMEADDIVFLSELVILFQRIDRRLHKLRDGAKFRFAQSSASH